MNYLQGYLPLAILLVVCGLLGLALLAAAAYLGPKHASAVKNSTFECGSTPIGSARQRFAVKFYVVGLLFIVFDLETVFLYPWAVLLKSLGWFGFVEMAIFVGTLAVALVYIWKKGALEWEQ